MSVSLSGVDVGAGDGDHEARADFDARQVSSLDEAAHSARVDAAQLAGGLLQGPE